MRVKIIFDGFTVDAVLESTTSPVTVEKIIQALPLEGMTNIWKQEVYFDIPVTAEPENPVASVTPGTLAYWPQGKAFCIFYADSQPAAPVNVVGKVDYHPEFEILLDAESVRVEKQEG